MYVCVHFHVSKPITYGIMLEEYVLDQRLHDAHKTREPVRISKENQIKIPEPQEYIRNKPPVTTQRNGNNRRK
jgi:hypothetical protein